jgi:hypothetical protein
MITAAHLVGHIELKGFINSNGQIDAKDDNQVSCSNYLKKFAGYEVDFSLKPPFESKMQTQTQQPTALVNQQAVQKESNKAQNVSKMDMAKLEHMLKTFVLIEQKKNVENQNKFKKLAEKVQASLAQYESQCAIQIANIKAKCAVQTNQHKQSFESDTSNKANIYLSNKRNLMLKT